MPRGLDYGEVGSEDKASKLVVALRILYQVIRPRARLQLLRRILRKECLLCLAVLNDLSLVLELEPLHVHLEPFGLARVEVLLEDL